MPSLASDLEGVVLVRSPPGGWGGHPLALASIVRMNAVNVGTVVSEWWRCLAPPHRVVLDGVSRVPPPPPLPRASLCDGGLGLKGGFTLTFTFHLCAFNGHDPAFDLNDYVTCLMQMFPELL